MASLNFCSDTSPKLPLRAMAYCHITLMHLHQGVDLDRVDLYNNLAPQACKPVSEITHGKANDLWQESHTEMPCRSRLGNIDEGTWLAMMSQNILF